MKKLKNITIISLILLLGMGISYALLSDTITVTGTATTTGTLDVNVISASVTSEVGSSDSTITFSGDDVTLNVPKLEYPGAYTIFTVTLKNEGSLSARLNTINEISMGDANISVSYTGIEENNILTTQQEQTFTIRVEWNSASTASSTDGATINMSFVFQQNV